MRGSDVNERTLGIRKKASIVTICLKAVPALHGTTDDIEERVHERQRKAKDNDFWMLVVGRQADGEGEPWSFVVLGHVDDVPTVLLDIIKNTSVEVVVGGGRSKSHPFSVTRPCVELSSDSVAQTLVDHVRLRTPFGEKPTSSRYSRMAPCATFFPQLRIHLFCPGRDPEFMAFCGLSIRQLGREPQLTKNAPDVIGVVPHVEVPPDQVFDSSGAPGRGREAIVQRTLPQEGADLFELGGGESGGASCRHRCLETAGALQAFLPVTDGVYGHAEVIGNRLL